MCTPSVSAPPQAAPLPAPPPIADNYQAAPVINDGTSAANNPGRLTSLAQLSLLHGNYTGPAAIPTDQLKLGQRITGYGSDGAPIYSSPTPATPAPAPTWTMIGDGTERQLGGSAPSTSNSLLRR